MAGVPKCVAWWVSGGYWSDKTKVICYFMTIITFCLFLHSPTKPFVEIFYCMRPSMVLKYYSCSIKVDLFDLYLKPLYLQLCIVGGPNCPNCDNGCSGGPITPGPCHEQGDGEYFTAFLTSNNLSEGILLPVDQLTY